VYEVKINFTEIIPPAYLSGQGNSLTISIQHDTETEQETLVNESITKLFDSLDRRRTLYRSEIHFVEQILSNLDREITFMAKYFHHCWSLERCTTSSETWGDLTILKQVMAAKQTQSRIETYIDMVHPI
jgi:hypothetical protein